MKPNFERLLRRALQNLQTYGNFSFTRRQLYYEICRTARPPQGFDWQTAAAIFGAGVLPALALRRQNPLAAAGLLGANAVFTGGLTLQRYLPHTLAPPFAWADFSEWLDKRNASPHSLIKTGESIQPEHFEWDLTLYGLPRLLICQSDEIAQMLRANQFNMEASCAVLNYREAVPLGANYQIMLKHAPAPRVFFLHDANATGYALLSSLREQTQISAETALVPLGLRPLHAQKLHLFATKTRLENNFNLEAFPFLSDDEKSWLRAGWTAEVSAVHPVRLLRVLRRLVLDLPPRPNFWDLRLPPRSLGFLTSSL